MTDRTLTPYEISVTDGESQYEVCQVLTVKRNGVTVDQHRDNGEPEDNCFYRDWRWVQPALEAAYRYGREDADKVIDAARAALEDESAHEPAQGPGWSCPSNCIHRQALDRIAEWMKGQESGEPCKHERWVTEVEIWEPNDKHHRKGERVAQPKEWNSPYQDASLEVAMKDVVCISCGISADKVTP